VRSLTFLSFTVAVVLLVQSVALGMDERRDERRSADRALATVAANEASGVEAYFARARSISLITAHNPAFRDFYALPGSRAAKIAAHGSAVREAEDALAYLERLYPGSVGEACFIDRGGAENARYVNGRRATLGELSSNETLNVFFKPTFALRPGGVYQATPYISPDTHEWVISNSTPLPGTGWPAAAIVHFEVTLESFRRTAAAVARDKEVLIVDARTGRVVVDSHTAQRAGAPLPLGDDHRFAKLVTSWTAAGAATIGGHRGAFRHLRRADGNANDWYVVAIDPHATGGLAAGAGPGPLGLGLAGIALLGLGLFSLRTARRAVRHSERTRVAEVIRNADERRYHDTQREFTEVMQITRDEDEAYPLLKRHLERSLPGSVVLVLNRNNSHDRLQPMTELEEGAPLAELLKDAEPGSCLAVRLGKPYTRGAGHEPLLTCELCSSSAEDSTCVPSLVGGEVIGSVLVRHAAPLDATGTRRVEESMTQASPVLANLRNLALSQARALTDGLTGLPNRRSVEDALKRMSAQAGRTATPLSVILFDLDHFKQVNDVYGHEKGDEVLAVVGATITANVRASDFAGRYGGEEFIVLLPDTDRAGACVAAEALRGAFAKLEVSGVSRPITASFGVATIPDDAVEINHLLRAADRGLYTAKAGGRNRVETVAAHPDDVPAA
jgi:diguanylate cyclase (GGDEF)-like protein